MIPTNYTYTGQYSYTQDFGLMFYNARWYDPSLGRFAQADSIIPPGVQGLDRYAYVNNSPVNYVDPSGHICVESDGDSDVGMAGNCGGKSNPNYKRGLMGRPSGWTRGRTPEESMADKFASILSSGATGLDILAGTISFAGTILEGAGLIFGESLTPLPGIDGAIGARGAMKFYNKFMNPVENTLGLWSLGMVATADVITNQTTIEIKKSPSSGKPSTELTLGPDTTFALTSIALGNTPLTPEAATDLTANIATVYYDIQRLQGKKPIWGLYQYHIGHENGSDFFDSLSWYDYVSYER
ncbi:MAG: RHS repeat-associated core domain-containing protein [Anaerolineales bacterium]|nr:RHS repeat-associated core domain-containing protein [Anaerolineales bacterium]